MAPILVHLGQQLNLLSLYPKRSGWSAPCWGFYQELLYTLWKCEKTQSDKEPALHTGKWENCEGKKFKKSWLWVGLQVLSKHCPCAPWGFLGIVPKKGPRWISVDTPFILSLWGRSELCYWSSLMFSSVYLFDVTVDMIKELGLAALLAKCYIKSAFTSYPCMQDTLISSVLNLMGIVLILTKNCQWGAPSPALLLNILVPSSGSSQEDG